MHCAKQREDEDAGCVIEPRKMYSRVCADEPECLRMQYSLPCLLRLATGTAPGSKYGACSQMGSPGTREGLLPPFQEKAEETVYRYIKRPGDTWTQVHVHGQSLFGGTQNKRTMKRYRTRVKSEAIGMGTALLVEHSTDATAYTLREGGEPMPKGPTAGKVKPGMRPHDEDMQEIQ